MFWIKTSQILQQQNVCFLDRDVWQMYLNKGDFELAKKYCEVGGLYIEFCVCLFGCFLGRVGGV